MKKWRTLARIIDYDVLGGEYYVYVVLPAWNHRLAVLVRAPDGFSPDMLKNSENHNLRCYAMAALGTDDYQDLDLEWCE